jgi:hypothetical protein
MLPGWGYEKMYGQGETKRLQQEILSTIFKKKSRKSGKKTEVKQFREG